MDTHEEARKLIMCTLCGGTIREPMTNSICFDVFCKFCIEEYIKISIHYLSNSSSSRVSANSCQTVKCPVCEKTFDRVHLLQGLFKNNPALNYIQKKSVDCIVEDKARIATRVKDSKQKLTESETTYNNIVEQLKFLEKKKLGDLNAIKQEIHRQVEMAIRKIKSSGDQLISRVENIISDFKTLLKVEMKYFEFAQMNARKLLTSLKIHFDDVKNEILVGLNIEKLFDRSAQIEKHSNSVNVSQNLMSNFVYKPPTSVNFSMGSVSDCGNAYVLPEIVPVPSSTDVAKKDLPLPEGVLQLQKKWSFCFRNAEQRSTYPSGICFSNSNRNLVVTELATGRLVSLDANTGDRKEIIVQKLNFNPLGLIKLCQTTTSQNVENFATIDKNSKTVFVVNNKKLYSIKKVFSLPQDIGHHGENFLVTDTHEKNLNLLTYDGELIWSTGGRKDETFQSPTYLSVCQNSRRIFVSDNNCLKIFDINGNFIKSFSESHWDLKGSCLDTRGNVIVVESSKNRLMKLDFRDGRYIEDVIPRNHFMNALNITMADGDDKNLCLTQADGNVVMFQFY